MRVRETITGAAACVWLLSAHAAAQTGTGGIAGVVRDATGEVVPGVTVEASSPALIEKTRTVVTDGSGQYSIVNLRPGVYVVTFTLTGFNTARREGIELTADFTAPVNVEMRVGALEETITVTGQSPVVDTRNVVQTRDMTRDVLDNIPTGKLFQSVEILVPGMSVGQTLASGGQKQDVGGTLGNASVTVGIHGGRPRDQQILFDGLDVSIAQSPAIPVIILQDGNVQEMSLTYGANPAESSTAGVRINMIPKDGGNTFRGSYFGNFSNSSLQANNVDDSLRQKGFGAPNRLNKIYDFNPTLGGPVLHDKLWFYGGFRYFYNNNWAGGVFYNQDPTAFVYKPTTQQGFLDQYGWNSGLRLTWQATPRNKVTAYYNYDHNCDCHRGLSGLVTPDAAQYLRFKTNLYQGTWTSPITSRLLLESGLSVLWTSADYQPEPGSTQDGVIEASSGVNSRFPPTGQWSRSHTYYARAALNYVTGTHALKVGFTMEEQGEVFGTYQGPDNLRYTLLNGMPLSVTYYTTPYNFGASVRPSLGVYAQDQWTVSRLTLNYGLRMDHFAVTADPTSLPPTEWLPVARNFSASQVVSWNDLSPRLSVAYDLFGTGKTALKANLSRYVLQLGADSFGAFYPTNASNPSTVRSWTDADHDFIVQGDPLNPAPNGELGPSSNRSFGQTIFTTTLDPAFATGYDKRPYNWDVSAGVQHQLLPQVSVSAMFYRRWFGNFSTGGGTVDTENLAYTPADFTPYCVPVPLDPRLPGGGGNKLCSLFDVNPAKVGEMNNVGTRAPGEYEHWTGVDLSVNARLKSGMLLQGGLSTGKTTLDKCATWNNPIWTNPIQSLTSLAGQYGLPPLGQVTAFCHMEEPFLSQVKFIASYPLPYSVLVSAAVQSIPGQPIYANYLATNAVIAPSLGRNLSSGPNGTVTVNVIPPGAEYLDRINQLDLRGTKSFTVMKTRRVQAMVDFYNIFNANTVTTANPSYGNTGSSWLKPIAILQGRFIKFGLSLSF
jgi:hypothetical protein